MDFKDGLWFVIDASVFLQYGATSSTTLLYGKVGSEEAHTRAYMHVYSQKHSLFLHLIEVTSWMIVDFTLAECSEQ